MLHVILTILAVIGIIILCILGLLLLIVSLVLFWPIKYKIDASYIDKKYLINIKVYWLLYAVCDKIKIDKDGSDNKLKIFGFEIGKEKKPKREKRTKKEKNKKESYSVYADIDKEGITEEKKEPEVLNRIREEKQSETKKEETKKEEKKPSILERIKGFYNKITTKIRDFKNSIKEKVFTILDVIKDENNKEALRFIKRQIFYLLKKIRPRKLKVDIEFGLGDPALTGQVLGLMAAIMGAIGYGFSIQPDFENRIIQGEIALKGRLFLFSILMIALRAYRNKGLRKSYKKLRKLKV